MRIGLFTDGLKHLSRRDAFAWCVEHGITDVEMSVGTWGARTHLDLDRLLADAAERERARPRPRRVRAGLLCRERGRQPAPPGSDGAGGSAVARCAGRSSSRRVLGIDRVVTMAGCPGGRAGGPIGVFGLWATSNDDEGLWSWQMEPRSGRTGATLSDWAAATAPGVRICLELHPGVSVYSVETFRALRTVRRRRTWG